MDLKKRIHELECQLDVTREIVKAAIDYKRAVNGRVVNIARDELYNAVENYLKYIGG